MKFYSNIMMKIPFSYRNWRQIEFDLAFQILIKILEVEQNAKQQWKVEAQSIITLNCASCKQRHEYYLKQVEQLQSIFDCRQFFTKERLVIADSMRKLKESYGVVQKSSENLQQFRYLPLQHYVQLPEKHSLLDKMAYLLKHTGVMSREALLLLREMSFEESLQSNRILSESWPEESEYLISYTQCLCLKNQLPLALAKIESALNSSQQRSSYDTSKLVFQRGNILGCMGEQIKAINSYKDAEFGRITMLECEEQFVIALMQYGRIDQIDDFIKRYKSKDSLVFFEMFEAYFQVSTKSNFILNGFKKLQEFAKNTQNTKDFANNFPLYNLYRGVVKFYRLRYEQSLRFFEKELKQYQYSLIILSWIVQCCLSLQNYQLALYYNQRLRQISHNSTFTDVMIAENYIHLREYAKAKDIMCRIEEKILQSNNPSSLIIAMQNYSKLGQYHKAIQYSKILTSIDQFQKIQAMITMVITYEKLKDQKMALHYYKRIIVKKIFKNCLLQQFEQLCFLIKYGYRKNIWTKRIYFLQMMEKLKSEMSKLHFQGLQKLEENYASNQPSSIELLWLE